MENQPKVRAYHAEDRARKLALLILIVSGVGFVAMVIGPGFIVVQASTGNVSVSWIIPTDKTISISYPTALTAVQFSPTTGTFPQLAADSQGASGTPAAFRVTNDGNVVLQLDAAFTATFLAGVAEFRIATSSSGGAPPANSGQKVWCGATSDTGQSPAGICSGTNNETASQTIKTGLAIGATHDRWAWSWGTAVAAGTSTKTLQITSS